MYPTILDASRTLARILRLRSLRLVMASVSVLLFMRAAMYSFQMDPWMVASAATLVLAMSVINVFAVGDGWLLKITFVLIAYFNYSIVAANYIPPITDSFFTSVADSHVSMVGLNVLLLFSATVTLLLPTFRQGDGSARLASVGKANGLLILFVLLALLAILIYGFERPSAQGVRGTPSRLYEYSLLLFIIGYYYSGHRRSILAALSVLTFAYVLQDLAYGGRATSIQLILCWFVFVLSHRARPIRMLPWVGGAYILFSAVGIYRASLLVSGGSLLSLLTELVSGRLILNTAYAAYYTSLTFVSAETFTDFNSRLALFGKFLASMVLGGSQVAGSSLGEYTRTYYVHYYGGVLPFYGYFYLGWFGVVVLGATVVLAARLMSRVGARAGAQVGADVSHAERLMSRVGADVSGLRTVVGVYLACSVVRWYLYSPSNLFRGVALMVCVYFLAAFANRLTAPRWVRKSGGTLLRTQRE